jgi:Major Facilitator Superfamily
VVPTCPVGCAWSRSQGQLGELAAGGDAYGGLSRQSSARDVGCNSGGRSCQSCRQVRPCDVSGLHSEEAPHEEKESEPNLKEHTGNREDETDVSEDLQDRPVGEEGVSGEPQIVRRLGISRASNRHGRTPSHRSRCFYRLHLLGAFGAGALVGTLVFSVVGHRLPRRLTFLACMLVAPVVMFGTLAATPPLAALLAALAVSGVIFGPMNSLFATAIQETTPTGLLGRVIGTVSALSMVGVPLGATVVGLVVAETGLVATLIGMGGIYPALAVAMVFNPALRAMDVRGVQA